MTSEPPVDGAFERLFRTDTPARDNYRSRLFALFNEEIVRIWAANERAPYRDLGRPTLWRGSAYQTIDFTLLRVGDGRAFVAEQKAELAWAGYSQLRLASASQVERHRKKPAFDWFLDLAIDPSSSVVKLKGKPMQVAGSILVWGALAPDGRRAAMDAFGFADVLSLEGMLDDLRRWKDVAWAQRINELRGWTNGLLEALLEEASDAS